MKDRVEREPAPDAATPQPTAAERRRERAALLRLVQAKLTVGAAGDRFEREADDVADRVMEVIQRMSPEGATTPVADVEAHRCGPGCLLRHAGHDHGDGAGHGLEVGADGGDLGEHLTRRVQQAAGAGKPLAPSVRRSMETAFGADFGGVRVHDGSDVAPRIGASAFTLGNDIHFAPGQYHPTDRSGAWLLSHELTHVVQQGGSAGCVRRHASKEHFLLGALTPAQISAISTADAKAGASKAASGTMVERIINGTQTPTGADVDEAKRAIDEQLKALNKWRTVAGPADAAPMNAVQKGATGYDHTWGGQMLTVQCRDGELPCTIGDMNALPDFFGSYDDLLKVDRAIAFKTFQVIRRETYIYLRHLRARLDGKTYSYNAKAKPFRGLDKNTISVNSAMLPDVGNAALDVMETTKMLKGKKNTPGQKGLDKSIGADATLGRNACHFPPESWLRWRQHHTEARALIAGSTTLQQLADNANKAIGMNAFGEHYLQDSYAAGHLINKGFVMAVAMEHVSWATKKARGMDDLKIHDLQTATAHKAAYDLPKAAKTRMAPTPAHGKKPDTSVLDDATMVARDPQSALESARDVGQHLVNQGRNQATAGAAAKRQEVAASGISPHSGITFEQYHAWLNNFWLQKITNTLHDKYCLNGLEVSSPDQRALFKVYGDANMMRSDAGAAYTAATSQMSRNAINALVENKRAALTPANPGAPKALPAPVASVEAILSRFPDRVVDDDGEEMSLKNWATGAPMRKKIKELVEFFTQERWKEGKLTGVIKAGSLVKDVSPGLTASHGPF